MQITAVFSRSEVGTESSYLVLLTHVGPSLAGLLRRDAAQEAHLLEDVVPSGDARVTLAGEDGIALDADLDELAGHGLGPCHRQRLVRSAQVTSQLLGGFDLQGLPSRVFFHISIGQRTSESAE